ncbi:PrpF domain-containing protein [Phycicoccus sp. M110.8]|uniref:PrpF domain-containing protein n=1 Tax=Phycicoccus sp. M110.8 TaxID=3075433 RepID=UPI0028FD3D94|nr:PrpF domain-containing protein [Phycicoccus sp. M110.8]MDU0312136.1 PrpF domain-containing protein [Phycicoccus sp. M110.8]
MQLRGQWYRGGTSKCWLFDAGDVARHAPTQEDVLALLADAFGAADSRQLDGVGGGTSTTSKAAVITATPDGPADLDYLFAQVGIGQATVELGSNCGNCATAIALYAVQNGIVAAGDVATRVTMRNLNTGAVLSGTVSTPRRRVPTAGQARVPGSTAPGVPVRLSFHGPWGQSTGALLPTGRTTDRLVLPGGAAPEVTMVDAGAPAVFAPASDLGVDLSSMTAGLDHRLPELLELRAEAGLAMGLRGPDDTPQHAIPKVGLVAPPAGYTAADGSHVAADTHDLRVRMLSMFAPHPAIGLTSAVALSSAATIPGSLVARSIGPSSPEERTRHLRIGTPAGVVATEVVTDADGNVVEVVLDRAARQLAVAQIEVARTVA